MVTRGSADLSICKRTIHYLRSPDGTIAELGRCLTGGHGAANINYRGQGINGLIEGANTPTTGRGLYRGCQLI